jgi:integrase
VADAVRDYLDWLQRNRKSADATEVMLNAYVLSSSIAEKRLADLIPADFDAWLAWAIKRRRRTRRKTGEARAAVAVTELFERLTAGKLEDEPLFLRADGSPWYRVALVRAMRSACASARVRPTATFHVLRHTYASHLVQTGVPLIFVAETLGHSDARMVSRHYGHLAPSHVADAIRAALPKFGPTGHDNVTDMRARKA